MKKLKALIGAGVLFAAAMCFISCGNTAGGGGGEDNGSKTSLSSLVGKAFYFVDSELDDNAPSEADESEENKENEETDPSGTGNSGNESGSQNPSGTGEEGSTNTQPGEDNPSGSDSGSGNGSGSGSSPAEAQDYTKNENTVWIYFSSSDNALWGTGSIVKTYDGKTDKLKSSELDYSKLKITHYGTYKEETIMPSENKIPVFSIRHEADEIRYSTDILWFPGNAAETEEYGILNNTVKSYELFTKSENLIIKVTKDKYTKRGTQYQEWGTYTWKPLDLNAGFCLPGDFGSYRVREIFNIVTTNSIADNLITGIKFESAGSYDSITLDERNVHTKNPYSSDFPSSWTLIKAGNNYKFYTGKWSAAEQKSIEITEGKYFTCTLKDAGINKDGNLTCVKIGDNIYYNTDIELSYNEKDDIATGLENYLAGKPNKINSGDDSKDDADKEDETNPSDQTDPGTQVPPGPIHTDDGESDSGETYALYYGEQLISPATPLSVLAYMGLKEGTDYSIDATNKKIILTDSGMQIFASAASAPQM